MTDQQPYALYHDLSYSADGHDRQRLDLYLPAEGGPFPLIIWFHGGGFRTGAREPGPRNPVPLEYLSRGFAVATVGYRLSLDACFPAAVLDAKSAVGWLRQQANRYQLDPERFVAWGHSAGGYLSAMVGLTAWCSEFAGQLYTPFSAQVSAVINEAGPINFLTMDDQKPVDGLPHNVADSPESMFMGRPVQEIPELVKTANPITYLNSAYIPRFLVIHGDQDKHVPYLQSTELVHALQQAGASVDFRLLDQVGHFDIDRDANRQVIDSFLNQ